MKTILPIAFVMAMLCGCLYGPAPETTSKAGLPAVTTVGPDSMFAVVHLKAVNDPVLMRYVKLTVATVGGVVGFNCERGDGGITFIPFADIADVWGRGETYPSGGGGKGPPDEIDDAWLGEMYLTVHFTNGVETTTYAWAYTAVVGGVKSFVGVYHNGVHVRHPLADVEWVSVWAEVE